MKKYNKKEYQRKYQLARYHKRRKEAIEKLGGKCVVCGTKENLEFDHIDQDTKSFPMSRMWSVSKERFESEILKCQILCHDHHVVKTKLYDENRGGGHNRIDDYEHGTWHMYIKDKCKCDKCKEWKRLYRAKLVDGYGNQLS